MLSKILRTCLVVLVEGLFGIILAIGSHGNPEMMLAVLFVGTLLGLAGGVAIGIIWT